MRVPKVLLSIVVFALSLNVLAYDSHRYLAKDIDVSDGLTQNSVLSVIQDRTGFIWMGTKDGLNRYDGTNIRRYQLRDCEPGHNYINDLLEADNGLIWMGTYSGLCYYDPLSDKVSVVDLNQLLGSEASWLSVSHLVKGPDGLIYAPLADWGTLVIDSSKREVTLRDLKFHSLCFDSSGKAYAWTLDKNLVVSSDNLFTFTQPFPGIKEKLEPYPLGQMTFVKGRLYNMTLSSFYVDLSRGEVVPLPYPGIYDMVVLPSGEIWVGTDNGLYVLDKNYNQVAVLKQVVGDSETVRDNSVHCLCADRDGGVWVGSYFTGVKYFANNYAGIRRYYPRSPSDKMALRVRRIVNDDDGSLWIGTEDNSIMRYWPGEDRFECYKDKIDLVVNSSNIHGLVNDGDHVWFGTFSTLAAMYRLDKKTLGVTEIPGPVRELISIVKARDGLLWLGTDGGLLTYDEDGGGYSKVHGITNRVQFLFQDDSDNIWAGMYGDGLWRMDYVSKEWTHYVYDKDNPSGVPGDRVIFIFQDSSSRIWVSTEGGGLAVYDPSSDSFRGMRDELPFSLAYSIVEDNESTLWITTNDGLVHYFPRTGKFSVFDIDDGFAINQFNHDSGVLASDGKIYFGCTGGMVSFDPATLSRREEVPPVVFTDFSVAGRPGDNDGTQLSGMNVNFTSKVTLRYRDNSFRIGVAQLDYRIPRKYSLEYMMKGYGNEWLPVSRDEIVFGRLDPGAYKLRVRVVNGDGSATGVERCLDVKVLRPLMLSLPMLALYGLAAFAALFVSAGILMRKARLKALIERDKEEMRKERDFFASKFEFFTTVAHDIRTPLALIKGPLEDIRNGLENKRGSDIMEDLDMAINNTDNLSSLVTQLLDFKNMDDFGYDLDFHPTDVVPLLDHVLRMFGPMERKGDIRLSFARPKERIVAEVDEKAMRRIFSNLLSNAFKYSDSFIELGLRSDSRSFVMTVTNDGVIVPAEMRESIFKPYVRHDGGKVSGSGVGLALCRTLAELHGGEIRMDEDLGVNRFVLTIPLAHADDGADGEAPGSRGIDATPRDASKSRLRMLVVEDNEDMRRFLEKIFSSQYDVRVAKDGLEALSVLDGAQDFDIVVSDVMMPRVDGFQLCRKIKENLDISHVPVILLTAKTDNMSKVEGFSIGADAYVEKPFSVEVLRTEVASVLGNRDRMRRHFAAEPFALPSSLTRSRLDEDFLNKLNDYLEKNIDNVELSVADMAEATCMSASNLLRKLKALTGVTPNEYLKTIRINVAASLLKSSECMVVDVSERVGFRSHSYFSSCFKKTFGMSPKEYQDKCKAEGESAS